MVSERFLRYLSDEKRYSKHTLKAYKSDLEQFNLFLEPYSIKSADQITHHIIRSWIVHLIEHSISNRSVNRKLTTLKSYFKFLLKEGEIKSNPMLKVLPPKTSKRLPVFLEQESMDLLLDEVDFSKDYIGQRDKLIIELFYATGMRLSELCNLMISDINLTKGTIKVLGKRNKERLIPLDHKLTETLNTYLKERIEYGNQNDYLFLTKKQEKIYDKLVYRIVNSYLSKVTSLTKKSPHVLRHTFATHMLNHGADLNAIKELLGHANLSATQVYTHNTIDKLKSIYKTAHPSEKA